MIQADWEACVRFHGHACGSLVIGCRAVEYARELLGIEAASVDEELVCIAENDACGVDAIQALFSCTIGKGNLIFHMTGKQAFTFYDRRSGKSVRLLIRATPDYNQEERLNWLINADCHAIFEVKKAKLPVPEEARIFKTCTCSQCGERAAENYMHLENGALLCADCWKPYGRGL